MPRSASCSAVALAQVVDGDGGHSSSSHTPAAGNAGAGSPVIADGDQSAVGLVADDDDGLAASRDGGAHVVGRRAGREPLVRLGGDARPGCDCLGRLACAQQRAREDGVGADAATCEALAQLLRLPPAVRRQRAKLVRLAGLRLRVAHEEDAHSAEAYGVAG